MNAGSPNTTSDDTNIQNIILFAHLYQRHQIEDKTDQMHDRYHTEARKKANRSSSRGFKMGCSGHHTLFGKHFNTVTGIAPPVKKLTISHTRA